MHRLRCDVYDTDFAKGWDKLELMRETYSDQSGSFELIKPKNFIDAPFISVVMSVCNGEKYLRESVDSILNQSCKDFEFIIINDGSIDGSLDILLEYQTADNRILIVNQGNIGLTRSLNRGIKLAAGKYIARQDTDDKSLPERLEKQVRFLETNSDYFLVGTACKVIDQQSNIIGESNIPFFTDNDKLQAVINKFNPFFHSSVMFRNDISCLGCFYNPRYEYAQDYELWTRISKLYKVYNLPEVLAFNRHWPEMISEKKSKRQRRCVLRAKKQAVLNSFADIGFWYYLLKDLSVVYLPRSVKRLYNQFGCRNKL